MSDLAEKKCVPCERGTPPLSEERIQEVLKELGGGWTLGDHCLEKEYPCMNFKEGLALVEKIAAIAEEHQHHPNIFLSYRKVRVQWWTHKIHGLSENDVIMAAKCDRALDIKNALP